MTFQRHEIKHPRVFETRLNREPRMSPDVFLSSRCLKSSFDRTHQLFIATDTLGMSERVCKHKYFMSCVLNESPGTFLCLVRTFGESFCQLQVVCVGLGSAGRGVQVRGGAEGDGRCSFASHVPGQARLHMEPVQSVFCSGDVQSHRTVLHPELVLVLQDRQSGSKNIRGGGQKQVRSGCFILKDPNPTSEIRCHWWL